MRIGILTDTHLPNVVRSLDDMGPQISELFNDVDLILHGGDIVSPSVLDWLEQFGDVVAALGNNDVLDDDPRVAREQILDLEGWRVGMVHSIVPHARPADAIVASCFSTPVNIVISG